MIRKTLTILSLIGLLLSVGLWGASYFWFTIHWGENQVQLVAGRFYWSQFMPSTTPFVFRCSGFNGFDFKRLKPLPPKDWGFRRAPASDQGGGGGGRSQPNLTLPGIIVSWNRSWDANGVMEWDYRGLILLWVPTLLFGIILFCLSRPLHRRRRCKRKKLGLCIKCGYDMRGSQERCPECGTVFLD